MGIVIKVEKPLFELPDPDSYREGEDIFILNLKFIA